ncbi:inositol monophosphatase family protein [Dermatobacter hominis]|uniref:inositol monophosphatase family protein n=1 Tax=Dermatobacter hominis TaxID=2884263 RepID=UPI001D12C850|nr:inositol monophosphatase family protein [Dermatobacter hominis]UDY35953.1 inositol monophosphatase [Dermatobacter hominis]
MSGATDDPYRPLLDVALEAAAAAVALVHDGRPDALEVSSKSSSTDLVTQMDRAAEAVIRDVIRGRRPDDVVMGEEMGDGGTAAAAGEGGESGEAGQGAVTWWVDPIDGTTNYVYDHPGWNVSVAAAVDGRVVAGVVADPTHGRTYRATRGGGAVCDDRDGVLRLADPPPLERALIATGFGYDREQRHRQGLVVAELLPRVRDIRRMGAAALDLCSVASGRVDAFYEAGLSTWDFAAGALIAEEAGARVGSLDGGPIRPGSALAAHPALFDELADLLAELGAG